MSIQVNWSKVCDNQELRQLVQDKINGALEQQLSTNPNLGITLEDIDFGSEPPMLQILKIGDLKAEKVELVCAFSYKGNASMRFKLNVEINPLVSSSHLDRLASKHMRILAADTPLPTTISAVLSKLRLNGTVEIEYKGEYYEDIPTIDVGSRPCYQLLKRWTRKHTDQGDSPLKKQTKIEPSVTIKLRNMSHSLQIASSFDGSPAADSFAKTFHSQIENGVSKLIDTPVSIPLSSSSASSSSSSSHSRVVRMERVSTMPANYLIGTLVFGCIYLGLSK